MANDTTPSLSRDEIRAALKRLKVTQSELADAMDVKQATISLWLDDQVTSGRLDAAIPAFIKGLELGSSRLV